MVADIRWHMWVFIRVPTPVWAGYSVWWSWAGYSVLINHPWARSDLSGQCPSLVELSPVDARVGKQLLFVALKRVLVHQGRLGVGDIRQQKWQLVLAVSQVLVLFTSKPEHASVLSTSSLLNVSLNSWNQKALLHLCLSLCSNQFKEFFYLQLLSTFISESLFQLFAPTERSIHSRGINTEHKQVQAFFKRE